jgi:hypothetical protein
MDRPGDPYAGSCDQPPMLRDFDIFGSTRFVQARTSREVHETSASADFSASLYSCAGNQFLLQYPFLFISPFPNPAQHEINISDVLLGAGRCMCKIIASRPLKRRRNEYAFEKKTVVYER